MSSVDSLSIYLKIIDRKFYIYILNLIIVK